MCPPSPDANNNDSVSSQNSSAEAALQQTERTVTAPALPHNEENAEGSATRLRVGCFVAFLVFDCLVSYLLMTPLIDAVPRMEDGNVDPTSSKEVALALQLEDLLWASLCRLIVVFLAVVLCFALPSLAQLESSFAKYHPNGTRKTREELEQEALEEPWRSFLYRTFQRPAVWAALCTSITPVVAVVHCFVRLHVEMGTWHDVRPFHPVYWCVLGWASVASTIQAGCVDSICRAAATYGKAQVGPNGILSRVTSRVSLTEPLLPEADEEQPTVSPSDEVGTSDIQADTEYKVSWTDLIALCKPDAYLLTAAFIFLILAAVSQTLIPLYLGRILDALEEAFAKEDMRNATVMDMTRMLVFNNNNTDDSGDEDIMFEVPGFIKYMKLLVLVSVTAGVFSGLRGSIFTVVGGRVNVRLRVQLMDSLLVQDIGFFDVTKTGDISSRLSSDTTLVGDQVTLNVNVFLRSLVQTIGVLGFMFHVSWQLSVLAFLSVPVITLLSRSYGNFVRALAKVMQTKLAEGNSVSESVFSSMPTVRAFDAASSELEEFKKCMAQYLDLNVRNAVAYFGYACMTTTLPELVFAVVIFYGGLLIRNDSLSTGKLVSFLLYLQSLSDAIASIGYVFSALTQAVGAADKVFELLNRKPRITPPTELAQERNTRPAVERGILGTRTFRTTQQRYEGVVPQDVRGEIELKDVTLYYPARPQRRVLNGLSLLIEPGTIVALVGQSGGGKSSVMSLIQHQYEPQGGEVLLDGIPVHELSPSWLSRNVSIVSQEPTLFARSIRKNIMYGLENTELEPSQEDIEEAARLANAHEFIQGMPLQYDTEVGERGIQLSGGQKQRIAIARALVRKPRILLLDEATSALDAESEHSVQQAIDNMLQRDAKGMTVVVVAHRLSTVRTADRIFVIKEGSVVESGSHDDLVKDSKGAYSTLIRRQMNAHMNLENSG